MRFEETIQFLKEMGKITDPWFLKDMNKSLIKSKGESYDIFTASNSFITFHKPGQYLGGYATELTWDMEHYDKRKKEYVMDDIYDTISFVSALARIMNMLSSEDLKKLFDTDRKFYVVYYHYNKIKIRNLDKKYYLAKRKGKEITVTAKELKILKILHDYNIKEKGYSYGMSEDSLRRALKQKTFPHYPIGYLHNKDLIYIQDKELFKRGKLDKFYNIGYKGIDILRKKGIIEPRKK